MSQTRDVIGTYQHNEDTYVLISIIDDARFERLVRQLARQALRNNERTAAMGNGAIRVKLEKLEAGE